MFHAPGLWLPYPKGLVGSAELSFQANIDKKIHKMIYFLILV